MFFKNLSTILSLLRESGAKVSVIFETSKSFGKFFNFFEEPSRGQIVYL